MYCSETSHTSKHADWKGLNNSSDQMFFLSSGTLDELRLGLLWIFLHLFFDTLSRDVHFEIGFSRFPTAPA